MLNKVEISDALYRLGKIFLVRFPVYSEPYDLTVPTGDNDTRYSEKKTSYTHRSNVPSYDRS